MHANTETGIVQPLEALGTITTEHDILFRSETVQSAGKIPIDVDTLGHVLGAVTT